AHPDDVLGVERSHRPHLALEAPDAGLAAAQQLALDALERQALAGLDQLDLIDRPHPPLAEQAEHTVLAVEQLPDQSPRSIRDGCTAGNEGWQIGNTPSVPALLAVLSEPPLRCARRRSPRGVRARRASEALSARGARGVERPRRSRR